MQSLKENIQNRSEYISVDQEYYNFIHDYKTQLIEKAQIVELTPEDIVRYNNRLKDIIDDFSLNKSLYWILLLINNLTIADGLNNRKRIYLPPVDYINELKLKYRHRLANKRKTPTLLS